ncbi:hypothetical protein NX059_008103 [Plenodomus lindquistii]|nr:hypothetical protein NX059_008103 [Plenodomus lindquistii]
MIPQRHELDITTSPLPHSDAASADEPQAPTEKPRSPSPAASVTASSDHLPRYWTDEEEALMHRTARDYDLILAYQRDSDGGERWHPEDIAEIRTLGQHFHGDRRVLNCLRHNLVTLGKEDEAALANIHDEKEKLLDYCERLDTLERSLENRPIHHLLNSGECEEVDGYVYRVMPRSAECPLSVASGVARLRDEKRRDMSDREREPKEGLGPEGAGGATNPSHHSSRLATPWSNMPSSPQTLSYRLHESTDSPYTSAQPPLEEGEIDEQDISKPKRDNEKHGLPSPPSKRQRVYSPVLTPPSSPIP